MMPYVFAAGHINYARYSLYYLRSMESLADFALEKFIKGEDVMRHIPCMGNGIWIYMFIETICYTVMAKVLLLESLKRQKL